MCLSVFFFQAEDGIRDLVRSRGLGDVYKRQSSVCVIGTGIRDELFGSPQEAGRDIDPLGERILILSLIHI